MSEPCTDPTCLTATWAEGLTHVHEHPDPERQPTIHRYCAHCGRQKEPDANYVDDCGWVSSTYVFCANCGQRKEPNRNYVHDECLCRDQRTVSPGEEGYADAFDLCPEPTCPLYMKAVMADHPHLPNAARRTERQQRAQIPKWVLLECGHYAMPPKWPADWIECRIEPCYDVVVRHPHKRRIVRVEVASAAKPPEDWPRDGRRRTEGR